MRVKKGGTPMTEQVKKDINCTVNINLPSDGTVKAVTVEDVVISGTKASIKLNLKLA